MRTDQENQGGHPQAFYLLASVVFFERLATSIVLSLLALYLREHRGFDDASVFLIVGGFIGGSYLASVPAGAIADGRLGQLRACLLGVGLLAIGQAGLLSDRPSLLGLALLAMLAGSGLFRVSLSTLIGRLYAPADGRREGAFARLYAAINLGYLIGPLGGEWMRARFGWPPIFLVAVAALAIGLSILAFGYRRIEAQSSAHAATAQAHADQIAARLRAIFLLCGIAVVFWMALQQTSTSLTFFAEENTVQKVTLGLRRLALAPGYFASLHGLQVLLLTPLLFGYIDRQRRRGNAPSEPVTIVYALLFAAIAFLVMAAAVLYGGPRASALWLFAAYFFISVAEVLYAVIGMSLISRLAPPRLAGRMNGLWFSAVAGGNLAASGLGFLWTRMPHHRYFALIAALLFLAAIVLLARSRRLESMLRD